MRYTQLCGCFVARPSALIFSVDFFKFFTKAEKKKNQFSVRKMSVNPVSIKPDRRCGLAWGAVKGAEGLSKAAETAGVGLGLWEGEHRGHLQTIRRQTIQQEE